MGWPSRLSVSSRGVTALLEGLNKKGRGCHFVLTSVLTIDILVDSIQLTKKGRRCHKFLLLTLFTGTVNSFVMASLQVKGLSS